MALHCENTRKRYRDAAPIAPGLSIALEAAEAVTRKASARGHHKAARKLAKRARFLANAQF